jgi:hypothetical protein
MSLITATTGKSNSSLCDANTYHILRGGTSTNTRGENLVKYLVSVNLNILKQGNKPTSEVRKRKEVIDLTLGTNRKP